MKPNEIHRYRNGILGQRESELSALPTIAPSRDTFPLPVSLLKHDPK